MFLLKNAPIDVNRDTASNNYLTTLMHKQRHCVFPSYKKIDTIYPLSVFLLLLLLILNLYDDLDSRVSGLVVLVVTILIHAIT